MSQYCDLTVSSGVLVKVRSRSYPEWMTQEKERLGFLESLPKLTEAGKIQELDLALQRANLDVREGRLRSWVKDFDKVQDSLTLRDIAEIEEMALALETLEVPRGNLVSGGDGALTGSGANIALDAEAATIKKAH